MRQKLFIILGLAILSAVLIGLNALSYTQKEEERDSESNPNRSTYNLGATGTRAFFDLLTESGRRTVRWKQPPAALLTAGKDAPATLVIVGRTRREIGDEDARQILRWVEQGGRLVLFDRQPPENLLKTTAPWRLFFSPPAREPSATTDAYDQNEMTGGIKAARPVQPTAYTKTVNGVQSSVFAAAVNFSRLSAGEATAVQVVRTPTPKPKPGPPKSAPKYEEPTSFPTPAGEGTGRGRGSGAGEKSVPVVKKTPPPVPATNGGDDGIYETREAPVVHLTAENRNLLVDVPYGAGEIVFLADPYIIANGGIGLVDNATLAINIVASGDGTIAFDEYHQGYGVNDSRIFQYFAGTPVIP